MLLTGTEDDTVEDDVAEDGSEEVNDEAGVEETAEEGSLPAVELSTELSTELSGVLSETDEELPLSSEESKLFCVISSEVFEFSPLMSISRSGSGKRMGASP